MKKFLIATLLTAYIAAPVVAAASSVGVNYSVNNVFGIEGEFDISSMTNNAPVSVQVFLKHHSQNYYPGVSWNTTGIGAAGIYDFNSLAKLDKKIHPYAGLGLISVTHRWRGNGPAWKGNGHAWGYSGNSGGLYFTGGVRYFLTPQFAADLNYNDFGDLTVGANFRF